MDRDWNITIDGLNQQQVQLLDVMWSFEDSVSFLDWKHTLNSDLRKEVDVLVQLIAMEMHEKEIQRMETYPDAEKILKKIAKKT